MALNMSRPQEDTLALLNAFCDNTDMLRYLFPNTYVPEKWLLNSSSARWIDQYLSIWQKAAYISNNSNILSKNPEFTGRLPELVDAIPSVDIIHIARNPYDTIRSTMHKDRVVTRLSNLQGEFSETEIRERAISLYTKIMNQYLENLAQIPGSKIVDLRYEDLTNPETTKETLFNIYSHFGWTSFEQDWPKIEAANPSNYKRNSFAEDQELLELLSADPDLSRITSALRYQQY